MSTEKSTISAASLDALAAPEGDYVAPATAAPDNGNGGGNPPPSPPADVLDDVVETPPATSDILDDQPASGTGPDGQPPAFDANAELRKGIAQQLSQKLGQKVEVPENVTIDNYLEFVQEALSPELHPEVVALQKALDEGKTVEQFYGEYNGIDNMLKMTPRELVTHALKNQYGKSEANPNGLEDAVIDRRVQAMEDRHELEFEAAEIRKNLEAEKAKRSTERVKLSGKAPAPPDVESPEFIKRFDEQFTSATAKAFEDKSLYGIKHADPDGFVSALTKRAREATTPTKANGNTSPFVKALSDPHEYVKIAALWQLAKSGKLGLEIGNSNRSAIKTIAAALDRSPQAASAAAGTRPKLDLAALARPEGEM